MMERLGKVKKGDGKDVHHKDGNPMNAKKSNLKVVRRSKNRSFAEIAKLAKNDLTEWRRLRFVGVRRVLVQNY